MVSAEGIESTLKRSFNTLRAISDPVARSLANAPVDGEPIS
jgi:hypothetical protein